LDYRYNRSLDLKQTDLSFAWPLSNHWSMVGRWNYDVQNKITLESFEGFEYDSCCWSFQVVHRRYITQTGQANAMIFFQLQLKGLTTIGRHLEDFLQNGILGYSDTTQPQ
ncbi:MAG TPA: LPS-assembly protein LptD, partial [Gammaproteobacteria bacterium]|nr:LPS-assembly protein LptD [Gammaproteobacteria bacterium]